MSFPAYRLGTTTANMTSLELLGVDLPNATPVDYGTYLDLGNSDQRGAGWLTCEWRWASLSLAQIAVVRTYLGSCYVQTLGHDGTYGNYSGVMVQPLRFPPKVDYVEDYYVIFRALVALT